MFDPSLLEPFPTVIELIGFSTEKVSFLQSQFNTLLAQPSYVSHARLASASAHDSLGEVRLALPLGMALRFTHERSYQNDFWSLSELSVCCLQLLEKNACCACKTGYSDPFIEGCMVYPKAKVYSDPAPLSTEELKARRQREFDTGLVEPEPGQVLNEQATWLATRFPLMEETIVNRLKGMKIDTFSALFIAQELTVFLSEITKD